MAEIELSILTQQCLDRCLPNKEVLQREIAAWEEERDISSGTVNWQFTTRDARVKLQATLSIN